jgi:hypothetical protein
MKPWCSLLQVKVQTDEGKMRRCKKRDYGVQIIEGN